MKITKHYTTDHCIYFRKPSWNDQENAKARVQTFWTWNTDNTKLAVLVKIWGLLSKTKNLDINLKREK